MSHARVPHLRVLGVDPGLTRCGIGVIDGPPAAPSHVLHDCLRTQADQPIEQRLAVLHMGVARMIAEHRPDLVAIERVLFSKNVRTAMATGQAAGVVLLAAAQARTAVVQLTPTDVKASVTGDGAADKDGVARLVTAQLGLPTAPTPADAADALAVALAALARHRLAPGPRPAAAPAVPDSSWEALVERRGLRVAGGTAAPDARQAHQEAR